MVTATAVRDDDWPDGFKGHNEALERPLLAAQSDRDITTWGACKLVPWNSSTTVLRTISAGLRGSLT